MSRDTTPLSDLIVVNLMTVVLTGVAQRDENDTDRQSDWESSWR